MAAIPTSQTHGTVRPSKILSLIQIPSGFSLEQPKEVGIFGIVGMVGIVGIVEIVGIRLFTN